MAQTGRPPVQIPKEDLQLIQRLKGEIQALDNKLAELEGERDEHNLVIKALTGLEPSRSCYRLVGGVLVQRTVGEVLPVVSANAKNITDLIKQIETTINQKNAQLVPLANKYFGGQAQTPQAAPQQGEPEKKKAGPGVLV